MSRPPRDPNFANTIARIENNIKAQPYMPKGNFLEVAERALNGEHTLSPQVSRMLERRSAGIRIHDEQTPALTDLYCLFEAVHYLRKQAAYDTYNRDHVPMGSEPIVDEVRGRTQREVTADGMPHAPEVLETHLHDAMAEEETLHNTRALAARAKTPEAIRNAHELSMEFTNRFDGHAKAMETGFATWAEALAAYAESQKEGLSEHAYAMLVDAAKLAEKASSIAKEVELGLVEAPGKSR
jgi:hypothetical protein